VWGGWGTAGLFLLGAVLVVGGSHLVVESGVRLALALGVPPIVLGLTVLAVGTSLPEVVTAVSSARQAVPDLALGNLLGANIANLTLIVGSAAGLREVILEPALGGVMFPGLVLAMVLAGLFSWSGGRVTRREGLVMVVGYLVYLAGVTAVSILA
jgi:cation:H+ antiporter